MTTFETATADLARDGVPAPEGFLGRIGPLGQLWYLRETARTVSLLWTLQVEAGADDDFDEEGLLPQVNLGIVKAYALLNECCAAMGILESPEGEKPPDDLLTK